MKTAGHLKTLLVTASCNDEVPETEPLTTVDANVLMMVFEAVQRAGVLLVSIVVLLFVWHYAGRGRWREALTDRFVYGVPWGSLVTILLVIAFYLFVQSGIEAWDDPTVLPFRSWSYEYLFGMLAAGFAHAGPGHLIGNMIGAAVFSPLVEYVWGHYPPAARRARDRASHADPGYTYPPPGQIAAQPTPDESSPTGLFSRPLVRALIVFPLAVILISILTSFFARGWSLGYSGTVFFFLGFAAIKLPLATIVGVVVMSGVNVLFSALQTPILTAGIRASGPSPPSWAGVNVQAHLLGFLLGVVLALELARRRDRLPNRTHLALAVVLVGFAQQLWSLAGGGGGTFVRYQALGVIFVLFLSMLIIAAVTVENQRIFRSLTVRSVILGGLVAVVVLLTLSSVPPNLPGMDDDPVPEGGAVEIDDYTITYAESARHGRVSGNSSGVIVVSEERDIWTSVINRNELAFYGDGTVTVGGFGWRETVDVERHGWNVAGNDTVYAVTLEHDERVHAFGSDSKQTGSELADHGFAIESTPGEFRLTVSYAGEAVASTAIPEANETITLELGEHSPLETMTVTNRERDSTEELFVESDGTRLLVADEE